MNILNSNNTNYIVPYISKRGGIIFPINNIIN